jgi:hypothetical protein
MNLIGYTEKRRAGFCYGPKLRFIPHSFSCLWVDFGAEIWKSISLETA